MSVPIQLGRASLWTIAVSLIDRGLNDIAPSPFQGAGEIIAGGVLIAVAEILYEKGYIPQAIKKAMGK